MFKVFFKWVLSWFVGPTMDRREEEVTHKTYEDDIIMEVTFTHPKYPLGTVKRIVEEPQPSKVVPKVTSEDIRSWLNAVREYDSVRSSLIT